MVLEHRRKQWRSILPKNAFKRRLSETSQRTLSLYLEMGTPLEMNFILCDVMSDASTQATSLGTVTLRMPRWLVDCRARTNGRSPSPWKTLSLKKDQEFMSCLSQNYRMSLSLTTAGRTLTLWDLFETSPRKLLHPRLCPIASLSEEASSKHWWKKEWLFTRLETAFTTKKKTVWQRRLENTVAKLISCRSTRYFNTMSRKIDF